MTIWSAEIIEIEALYTSFSGQHPDLEKELEQLIKAENENVVLLYSRRCLEVIVTVLCECELNRPRKTEPLKGIIDKLNKEEKVPSHIITSMLNLNSLSAYGTHPKEFDPEQVKPVLNNLTTIIKWYQKYKDTQAISKPEEQVKDEIKDLDDSRKTIHKPKKRLILLLSGLSMVAVVVIVVLLIFNDIGGKKQIKELEKSIAVLPFDNLSIEEEYSKIGEAITDEIILELYKIKEFDRVISRSSTMQYKENRPTIPEIANDLGVNYIIEGSIRRYEENVNIIVQVLRAEKEDHVWGDEYNEKWKDIHTIQDDIAKKVAYELKIVLSPEEVERIEDEPTENIEAYNLYLQGRHFWNLALQGGQVGEDYLDKSIEYYQRALEIDPDYALAYSGMAITYTSYTWQGYSLRRDAILQAKTAAMKALERDNTLGEAHTELAQARHILDFDWYGSEKEFKHALELNPNYARAHNLYAWLLSNVGRFDEAIQESKRAHELDPLSEEIWVEFGRRYYFDRDYDKAIEEYRKALEIFPNSWYVRTELALALSQKGLHNEAIEEYSKAEFESTYHWHLGYIYGVAGYRENALEILNYYLELSKKEFVWSAGIAIIYIGLGDKDKAFEWLEKTYEQREAWLEQLKVDPMFDSLRPDPRFQDLVDRMNFPD